MARHFNYMGEGVLSFSIGLIFGHFTNPWAWIYFVLIVTLFTFRQRDDDRHCAEKYGAEKWAEYKARVKYRIPPGVYGVDPPASVFARSPREAAACHSMRLTSPRLMALATPGPW